MSTVYVVNGAARTGTTMMCSMLAEGGMDVLRTPGRDKRLTDRPRSKRYSGQPGSYYEVSEEAWRSDGSVQRFADHVVKRVGPIGVDGLPVIDGLTYRVVVMLRDPRASEQSMRHAFGHGRRTRVEDYWPLMGRTARELPARSDVEDLLMFWYPAVLERPLIHVDLLISRGWPITDRPAAAAVPDAEWFRHRMPWEEQCA